MARTSPTPSKTPAPAAATSAAPAKKAGSSCCAPKCCSPKSSCCGNFFRALRLLVLTAAIFYLCYTLVGAAGAHCLKKGEKPAAGTVGSAFCDFVQQNSRQWTLYAPAKSHSFTNEAGVSLLEHNVTLGLVVPMLLLSVFILWVCNCCAIMMTAVTMTSAVMLVSFAWSQMFVHNTFVLASALHFRDLGIAIAVALLFSRSRCSVISLVSAVAVAYFLFVCVEKEHPALVADVSKQVEVAKSVFVGLAVAVRRRVAELGAEVANMINGKK